MANMENPVDHLSRAVYSAILTDLFPVDIAITNLRMHPGTKQVESIATGEIRSRRPEVRELSVTMFPQQWSSTCLGFDGIGGQAFTTAYTIVVIGPERDACVYFAGRLAYHVKNPSDMFAADLNEMRMAPVRHCQKYEKLSRIPEIDDIASR